MSHTSKTSRKAESSPLVSVIMNCYNSDRYLRDAIDSVLAQTYENWEIIFWDNQSTDQSAEIVKNYKDLRIKYFYAPKHTVLGEARLLAVQKARGDWVAFLDCDDLWYPEKLEKQLKAVEKCKNINIGVVYCGCDFWDVSQNRHKLQDLSVEKMPDGNVLDDLLCENFVALVSALINKNKLLSLKAINPCLQVAEDYYMLVAIASRCPFLVVREILCMYREHPKNLSHNNSDLMVKEVVLTFNSWSEFMTDKKRKNKRKRELYSSNEKWTIWRGIKRKVTFFVNYLRGS